jgi:Undecaprenyl-phosphate glucose phosphotransferase
MTTVPHQWQMGPNDEAKRKLAPLSSQVIPSLFVVLDSVAILASALVTFVSIVGYAGDSTPYYIVAVCFVWLTSLLLMNFAGLYQFEPFMRPLAYADKIIIAFITTFLFLLAAAFALKISETFSRVWVTTFAAASCSATFALRLFASALLRKLSAAGVLTREVVIAGGGKQLNQLLDYVERVRPPFVRLRALFIDNKDELGARKSGYEVLGSVEDVVTYARLHSIDDVIVALPWASETRVMALVNKLRELALNVYLGSDLIGFRLSFQAAPGHFGQMPIFEVTGSPFSGWNAVIKRAEDYIFGGLAAVLFLPLMLVIALAIKIESRGPVLFRQKRLGFLNQEFSIYKFRTMKYEAVPERQTLQATRGDPRVTRVGRLLRRTSLDELPNLINVLNGTMSLVGPRPHAVDHNDEFSQIIGGYFIRHRVKPGITGWAQVNGFRGQTDTVEKIEGRVKCDIYYAENWSFWFDIQILLMSVIVCLSGRNAY